MDDKSPIPVPPAQRWREFRIQLLPYVIFIAVAIVIAALWKRVVAPVNMVGEVPALQYQVRSLMSGTITDLRVEPFTYVQKGEEIGHVSTIEPQLLEADLAVAKSDLELAQFRTGFSVEQNVIRLRQLSLDRDNVRAQLERTQADLLNKRAEFDRQKELFKNNLTSKEAYAVAETALQVDIVAIDGLKKMVDQYDAAVKELDQAAPGSSLELTGKALQAKTNQIVLSHKPISLKAPADGIVTAVLARAGEKVRAGDPLVTVAATNADYIIGYLRQPLGYVPKIDDAVVVRTRATPRASASAKVVQVGGMLDYINPAIVTPDNTRKEKALPVKISIPPELGLRPGEFVDLLLARP
ncbi:MAG TPA: hypothetical protein DCM86_18585 [Verrucomicrobiales bacterium]|nr:hypothetical protein [Verrucomicrobiales bacterium]